MDQWIDEWMAGTSGDDPSIHSAATHQLRPYSVPGNVIELKTTMGNKTEKSARKIETA